MDGFWDGVQYYNQVNHTSVKVLGWNPNTSKGYRHSPATSRTSSRAVKSPPR